MHQPFRLRHGKSSSEIPLRFESSPFRGNSAADTTAKPMKSLFRNFPLREGAVRAPPVRRPLQPVDGATAD